MHVFAFIFLKCRDGLNFQIPWPVLLSEAYNKADIYVIKIYFLSEFVRFSVWVLIEKMKESGVWALLLCRGYHCAQKLYHPVHYVGIRFSSNWQHLISTASRLEFVSHAPKAFVPQGAFRVTATPENTPTKLDFTPKETKDLLFFNLNNRV